MRAIGCFHLDYHDEGNEDESWLDLPSDQAVFTLTEILTGIPLHPCSRRAVFVRHDTKVEQTESVAVQ